ncbi:MAG: Nif3-like dinuclear metal center hexameric protein [Desulfuromonas sp.]|nr:MAG: Nif3-like dinuclear metal center hexameric protein [Desulfuromonas sp.]
MASNKKARVQDILGLVNAVCPASLAEEWDNVGLQVGDPASEVARIAIALDPTEATLDEAIAAGAQMLICHHPLIFKPLQQITPNDQTGKLVIRAIREDFAILAAHTNLDRAHGGLNDWLAGRLGVETTVPLESPEGLLCKLVVYVPVDHREAVASAIFSAGGGQIGNYDQCSFRTEGVGTFRPGDGTDPYIGDRGKSEEVPELRLETVVPKDKLGRVVAKMTKAHPYEEVAYDIIPLVNGRPDVGLGRIGRLEKPATLGRFADGVKQALGADHVRVVGDAGRLVEKIAVCGGSGASLLAAAARQGADVLVTGDVKYHDALIAEALGVALVDAGHFATEIIMVEELTELLRKLTREKGFEIDILPLQGARDPFAIV